MKIFHLSDPHQGWINITFGYEGDSFTIDSVSEVPNACLKDLAVATLRVPLRTNWWSSLWSPTTRSAI